MPHPFDGFVAAAKVFADANDEAIRDDVGRGQFMNVASPPRLIARAGADFAGCRTSGD
jgi:hypothetical protein